MAARCISSRECSRVSTASTEAKASLRDGGVGAGAAAISRPTRKQQRRGDRVVIVDDSAACREVFRELLERRGYDVAGEAASAASATDLIDRLRPAAVLLDVHLPDGNGFELAAYLSRRHPDLAILLTSIDFRENFYALADVSGARGFVPKTQLAQVQFGLFWSARARA